MRLYERLGAHPTEQAGQRGVMFAVWAPEARRVSVVGDFNQWDGRAHPMTSSDEGIWRRFIPGVGEGALYKFELISHPGDRLLKLDPFAFRIELRPNTAAIVHSIGAYPWTDGAWMAERGRHNPLYRPWSIYELHAGSWRRLIEETGPGAQALPGGGHSGRWLTYRELARPLVDYVKKMGFTHVEFMPLTEHPLDRSWGYQVTGYYAPTSRYGGPDDLRYLIDQLHGAGIGVLLDWVPAHFPKDGYALGRFDGSALYEHMDPRQGDHPDWGTHVFNYGRFEVRDFLLASADFWMREYHFDGLRVDAVASMLYRDYSRGEGEWVPNAYGGRENIEAIAFLRDLNQMIHAEHPGGVVVAEESTAWPAVSRPTYVGGLGFTFKWNMGWMHDTLCYFQHDPVHRRYHQGELTFSLLYAWSENFILPLSHDEVVHGKRSLLDKMPGDAWQRFANLRALFGYMWAHPGKKLLFAGGEFAQGGEFSEKRSLDWHLLERPAHAGVQRLVADLNRIYKESPALWELDVEPGGFRWIDANDTEQSVLSFLRFSTRGDLFVCVLNATPVVRHGYRIGVPEPGDYLEILNTDSASYGGSGVGNLGRVRAEPVPSHGHATSLSLTLPPLGVLWFVPARGR